MRVFSSTAKSSPLVTAPAIDSSENRAVFRRATQNVSLVNTAT